MSSSELSAMVKVTSHPVPQSRSAPVARLPKAGFTLVEAVTGAGLVLLALVGLARVVLFAGLHADADRELELVQRAAERVVNELRWANFEDVYALDNEDAFDDPLGVATAPGNKIHVRGLCPGPAETAEPVGRILFPAMFDFDAGVQLREDVLDPLLGMPRDLNGDGRVDHRDHADDYALLPVRVRFEWTGAAGPSVFEVETLLAEY